MRPASKDGLKLNQIVRSAVTKLIDIDIFNDTYKIKNHNFYRGFD